MPILDHFDFIAPYYDRIFQPGDRDWLHKLVDLPTSGFVLDAGGGTGRISQYMRDKAKQVVVVDLSFEMLTEAQGKGGLLTACSHSEKLPFKSEFFDRIIMIDALHHVCDQLETAQELWRLLKPGGRIVIEEPDIRTLGVKFLAAAEKVLGMRSHFLSPPKIEALFGQPAQSSIERKGVISWVIIEKPGT